jgi:hypothetical protein
LPQELRTRQPEKLRRHSEGLRPKHSPLFRPNHALSGEFHDREALREWFELLGRLGTGLNLLVHEVWVKRLLNDTTIIVRWSATNTRVDGSSHNNHGVHIIRMCCFKVVDIDTNEDSQAVVENLLIKAHLATPLPPGSSYRWLWQH